MRDPRRFSLAALAYLVATFPLGYLWHLNWFHSRYEQLQMFRAEVLIPLGVGSMLIQALVYAALYPRLFAGRHWLRGASGFGLLFGTLAWSLTVLPVAAKYRTSSVTDFLVLESAFTIVQYLVVSPLIALAWRGASEPGMPYDAPLADAMRDALRARPGITERKMFGGICWLLHGNMLCGVEVGRYMFRVGAEQHPDALALPGARPMDITGRPMRGFVWVDASAATGERLSRWIALAERFVGSLPPK